MKILAFSDLHHSVARAKHIVEASQDADLVIGAGDFCNARQDLDGALGLLAGITAPFVAVPGNAESVDELRDAAPEHMTVLHGTGTELMGLTLFGLGYAVPETPFGGWSCDLSEGMAADALDKCHSADILILHSPPKGIADISSDGRSLGSTAIRAAIERIAPGLAVCGHIHDSWGQSGRLGTTDIVNLGPTPNWFTL